MLVDSYTLSGVYEADGTTDTVDDLTVTSTTDDVSGVYLLNGADITLNDASITTSGDTSSGDDSSFYGLNAGVLATDGSTLVMSGGTVSTSGTGANGVFSTGSGTTVTLTNTVIRCTGQLGHGIDATVGGTLIVTDLDVETYSSNGAAIATDRGSGTITVVRGSFYTAGTDSPGIYSTGVITVTDAVIEAVNSEAAVIEGVNSITLYNTQLSGSLKRGVCCRVLTYFLTHYRLCCIKACPVMLMLELLFSLCQAVHFRLW